MKRVIVIIRNSKYYKTKEALISAGFSAFSSMEVMGKGMEWEGFLARKLLMIWVNDEELDKLIQIIIKENQTKNIGDGVIFVSDTREAIRISTGAKNEEALS